MTITAAPTTVATEVQDDIEGKVWIAGEVWVMSTRAGRLSYPGFRRRVRIAGATGERHNAREGQGF
jgi:hypothetical protein